MVKRAAIALVVLATIAGIVLVASIVFAPPGPPGARGPRHSADSADTTPAPTPRPAGNNTNVAHVDNTPATNATNANSATTDTAPTEKSALTGQVVDATGKGVPLAMVIWMGAYPTGDPADDKVAKQIEQFSKQAQQRARWFEDTARDEQRGISGGRTRQQGTLVYTRADQDGRFRLEWGDTEAGLHGMVAVSAPDFETRATHVLSRRVEPMTIELQLRTAIAVRVVDAAGEPIAGARVTIWSTEYALNGPTPDDLADSHEAARQEKEPDATTNNTGADGRVLHDTRAGRTYHAVATSQSHLPGFVANIKPPDANARVVLPITIQLQAGQAIKGQVVDQDGRGVPYPTITLGRKQRAGWGRWSVQTNTSGDLEGQFTMGGIEAGESDLSVYVRANGYTQLTAPIENRSTALRLEVKRWGVISGRLLRPDGSEIPDDANARVTVEKWASPDDEDENARRRQFVGHSVEWYWTDADGHALGPDGKADARYEQPGSLTGNGGQNRSRTRPTAPEEDGGGPITTARRAWRIINLRENKLVVGGQLEGCAPAESDPIELAEYGWVRNVQLRLRGGVTMRGTVRTADGQPVAGATVTASDRGEPSVNLSELDPFSDDLDAIKVPARSTWELTATTDETGAYEIVALPGGRTQLIATPSKQTPAPGLAPGVAYLDVPASGKDVTHDFTLKPALTITGRVVLADGGVAHAQTNVAVQRGADVRWRDFGGDSRSWQAWQRLNQAINDDRRLYGEAIAVAIDPIKAEFVVSGLAPGRYSLTARAHGGTEVTVTVKAGDTDVVITLGPVAAVSGTVLGPDGNPPTEGMLTLGQNQSFGQQHPFSEEGSTGDWSYDPATGAFRVSNIPPGTYDITAVAPDCAAATASNTAVGPGAEATVNLQLIGLWHLEVLVRDANGAGVREATVMLQAGDERPPRQLPNESYTRTVTTDGNGFVRVDGLGWPMLRITARTATMTTDPIAIDLRHEQHIEIRLGKPGVISGTVRGSDGGALVGAMVRATSNNNLPAIDTVTDGTGAFRLEGVSPGIWGVSYSPPGAGEPQPGWGGMAQGNTTRWVQMHDGEEVHLQLGGDEGPVVVVTGHVTRGGEPVPGSLTFIGSGQRVQNAQADKEGLYKVELGVGEYIVAQAWQGRRVRIVVPDAPTATIDIVFGNASIIGTVTDSSGNPVVGAQIEARAVQGSPDRLSRMDAAFPAAQATSRRSGEYRITPLEAGTWDLWVRATRNNVMMSDGRAVPSMYVGQVRVGNDAEAVHNIRIDVVGGTLVLHLEAFEHAGLANATVELADSDGRLMPLDDGQGWGNTVLESPATTFANIAPGSYTLRLHINGAARINTPVRIDAGKTTDVHLGAEPGGTLVITLPFSSGSKPVDWRLVDASGAVIVPPAPRPQSLILRPGSGELRPGEPLTIEDLPPGQYLVEIITEGGRRVRGNASVTSGSTTRITIDLR